MSHVSNEPINPMLAEHIEATRALDESLLDRAVAQFRSDLPTADPERKPFGLWFRMAGAAAVLALMVSLAPLVIPGKVGANAFAEAQAWFESYRTLQFMAIMRQNEIVVNTIEVWSDEAGNTRVDMPPVSHIVLPSENVMHTVMPDGQVMSNSLGLESGSFDMTQELEWLGDLLEFQGLAEVIEAPREIEGINAMGWRLELPGGVHTLWVDPADNRPMLLDAELGGGLTLESQFRFDEALPTGVFDLPGLR